MNKIKLTGKRCYCNECGNYFSTVANFDRHRIGRYGKDRRCAHPYDVGLVKTSAIGGHVWKMPGRKFPMPDLGPGEV